MLARGAHAIYGEPFREFRSQYVKPGACANGGCQEDEVVSEAFGFPCGAFALTNVNLVIGFSFKIASAIRLFLLGFPTRFNPISGNGCAARTRLESRFISGDGCRFLVQWRLCIMAALAYWCMLHLCHSLLH